MRIIIAPDKFKESLPAAEVAETIAAAVREVVPDAQIDCIPMADGGEGTVDALVRATGGEYRESSVGGPLGEAVVARWGMLGGDRRTAIIEMAAASGLALVSPPDRNPLHTSTFGTGELIQRARSAGAHRVIIGIGGSATVDGGAGAAQAAGVAFRDSADACFKTALTGGMLSSIASIDAATVGANAGAQIDVACDVINPLCGPNGAAAIFGPQKGATPAQVATLDRNLDHLAGLIQRDLGLNVRDLPGAGAAGGLGAGLVAFFGARLRRGVELVMDAVQFRERIAGADLIITGEGRLDAQSLMGKVIGGIAEAAGRVPVVALVGATGDGAEATRRVLADYRVITPQGMPRPEAFRRVRELLHRAAVELMRSRLKS